jgi:hypothetical protein
MTGTKEIRCRCGKRYSVSSLRNPNNEFICPDCVARQSKFLRKDKPICPNDYQVTITLLNGSKQHYIPMQMQQTC